MLAPQFSASDPEAALVLRQKACQKCRLIYVSNSLVDFICFATRTKVPHGALLRAVKPTPSHILPA